MKKFKNFWKYLTITLLLLLGLVCAGVLYMFFVGAPLFGFKYISYNKDYQSNSYAIAEVNTVVLNSRSFNISVLGAKTEEVSLKVHNGAFGFAKTRNANFNLAESLTGGVLQFNITEPHGMASVGSSKIELFLPADASLNLKIINNSANTTLKTDAQINNLTYQTNSGNFKFESGKVDGQMNLDVGRAKFEIADSVETNLNDVNLQMTSGSFNCPNKEFNSINLISSTSGVIRASKCEQINGNNQNAGGSITISSVENANLVAGDTNVKIDSLTSGMIEIFKTGKIEIGRISGRVNLHTESGNILVKESLFEISCTSNSGDVRIEKSYKVVNAETQSGNIFVNFDFDENKNEVGEDKTYQTKNGYLEDKDNRRLIAQTATGTINCYGVENVEILVSDSGHANVYMENVLGRNIINAEKTGSVYVEVREFTKDIAQDGWAHFNLQTHSKGSSRVNFTQMNEPYGKRDLDLETDINPTPMYNPNALIVNVNFGNLIVLDSITAKI